MDDPVPTIDFSPTGPLDLPYSLERPDIDGKAVMTSTPGNAAHGGRRTDLLHVLDDLEHFAEASQDPVALSSVREARSGLDKLIGKMDSLESGFDRIAERSCEALCIHFYVRLQLTSAYAVFPVLSEIGRAHV